MTGNGRRVMYCQCMKPGPFETWACGLSRALRDGSPRERCACACHVGVASVVQPGSAVALKLTKNGT